MARADYLICSGCDCKIVYNANDDVPGCLCAECAAALRARVAELEAALMRIASPRNEGEEIPSIIARQALRGEGEK